MRLLVVTLLFVSVSVVGDQATKDKQLEQLMELQGLTEMIQQQQAYSQEQAKLMAPRMLADMRKEVPELSESTLAEDIVERAREQKD